MKIVLALVLLLLTPLTAAQSLKVVTLPVTSRPAAAFIDVVRPLLGKDGGVSAFHDKLVVKGTAQEIARVRRMLKDIDKPARRLIIEVRRGGGVTASSNALNYGVSSDHVRIGKTGPGGGARLSYRDLATRARDGGSQQVQALDGRPALIRTGQSVPQYRAYQQLIGNQAVQGFDMRYRNTSSGFVALPRVRGDQVTIEIYQQHERPTVNGRFDLQQASTVLRGGLGDWLVVGSTGGSTTDSHQGLGYQAQTQRTQDRQIELRVIAID